MTMPANRGDQIEPQVNPLAVIEAAWSRLCAWVRKVGEMRVAWAVLAAGFALAAALILVWGKGQTFINDEWNYLVVFRGWSLETLLHPQNGHLVAFPLIIYKAMFGTVGASSHLPYQVATVVLHLLVATLFFLLVRTRVALFVAVALTILIAFFGAGWDTVMGAYELPNLLGMAAGLGMLLALARRTRGGDLLACVLLAISLGSFSVGIAFALGALLAILLGGRTEWRRAWIVLLPGAVYVVWFLWARQFGQSEVTLASVSSVFVGSADQMAAICAGITGLFRVPGSIGLPTVLEFRPDWGYPLALGVAGLIALHIRRAPRSIHFWTLFGTLVFYLGLVAVGLDPARTPEASRYVYMGSILTLLLIVELARDVRWSTTSGLVAVVIFGLALIANAAELRAGGRLFQAEGETNRAALAALELDRRHVDEGLPAEAVETTVHSHADMLFPIWAYFETAEESGSPAYSLDELLATGEQAREAADQELVNSLEIAAEPVTNPTIARGAGAAPPKPLSESAGHTRAFGGCVALIPDLGRTASFKLELPPGGFSYKAVPGTPVGVKLGRFGDQPVIELPPVTGSAEVAIPVDDVPVPWQAEVRGEDRLLACAR
jgi:hypothetical protein